MIQSFIGGMFAGGFLATFIFCACCLAKDRKNVERMTNKKIRQMKTPARIKAIEKILEKQACHTEYYNGHNDLDAIADYFISKGHKVERSKVGGSPIIYRKVGDENAK